MTAARNQALATQARRVYLEALVRGLTPLVAAVGQGAGQLLAQGAPHAIMMARRDAVQAWQKLGPNWQMAVVGALRHAALHGVSDNARDPEPAAPAQSQKMSLVDDSTIEREIISSRLALVMMDRATWEFTDLRTRMQVLEAHDDLEPLDLLRAHVIARVALDAWTRVGLDANVWQLLHNELHEEFAQLISEAYHETNRWLIAQKVLPDVDLRPFIRRTAQTPVAATAPAAGVPAAPSAAPSTSFPPFPPLPPVSPGPGLGPTSGPGAMPALPSVRSKASSQADEVMAQLQRVLARHVPGFPVTKSQVPARPGGGKPSLADVTPSHPGALTGGAGRPVADAARPSLADAPSVAASPRLMGAIKHAQESLQRRPASAGDTGGGAISTPRALEEIGARNQAFKQVLKQAANTPAERATIEIVAMMFQSILTEERIPATVRVWFARLQMPVLRVAVSEPDFFAAADHPARRLIDRMGACVMGFNTAHNSGPGTERASSDALEREIKRVVQVVEAYPDTGRRVFATVLTEFEKFLDHYFENENQASKRGVSLAQQVEQRETLAIQYTIELRKMLSEVPVQDGVRDFLFHVWADVLAVTAVRAGPQADVTKVMKRAAADLIWSASSKASREERADVIRRLPPLLKTLRDGMSHAGIPIDKQDEHVRQLNNALAAAFTAKTAAIPRERLDELMDQLETLEAMLPENVDGDTHVDEMLVRDLSGHESDGMEVVAEGGSAPTPAMVAWARELQVGGWFMLDYRGRNEQVQLAWRGLRKQLALFVTPKGRGVLFSLNRMAAFLQAGLLLPAQDEALTVQATRKALAKLDADPEQLLK
ncbi:MULTISPECIES: DUF1631 family protein [unclassified Roseateles]|uniref:DUF1631 family protein n=1 Tax=unclassified Roseateles TaxID=2626991 RepID=UPI0006F3CB42|nr:MULTISPECIES: DUF1631 family protein [unclassified Roseateles]KQW51286.1 hypothetical protein ASC81_01150 [Pelomonas sp. Root405]KRA77518.1 hypothetical protein ASD88_01150 [Pelomonas sp. Root662]